MKRVLVFLVVYLGLVALVEAKVWSVPSEIPTIKVAVEDSAQYGDTVLVAPGIYDTSSGEVFPINIKDGVVLMSEEGCDSTIIDANFTARVINCEDVESLTVISGFTITGGSAERFGGGILCDNASPIITNNLIFQNTAWFSCSGGSVEGGGICCHDGSPLIAHNTIRENSARNIEGPTLGGGIGVFLSFPIIYNNTIDSNSVGGLHHSVGGGIWCNYSSIEIVNNIVANTLYGGGIVCGSCSTIIVSHNNVWNNVGGNFTGCPPGVGDTSWGVNRNGTRCDSFYNIISDPLFTSCAQGWYYLSQTDAGQPQQSPCVDAGSALAELSGLDSCTTRTDSVPDSGWVDIGYHYKTTIQSGSGIEEPPNITQPSKFYLRVCPNPFITKTVIQYAASSKQYGDDDKELPTVYSLLHTLCIYDLSGRLISSLPITDYRSPITEVTWDGKDMSGKEVKSGVYFLRVKGNRSVRGPHDPVKVIKLR